MPLPELLARLLWFLPAAWLAFTLSQFASPFALLPFALAGWFLLLAFWIENPPSRPLLTLALSFAVPLLIAYALLSLNLGPALGLRFFRRLLNPFFLVPLFLFTAFAANLLALRFTRPLFPLFLTLLLIPAQLTYNRWSEDRRRAELEAALRAVPAVPAPATYDRAFFQRGVNFTSEGPRGYHPTDSAQLLDTLKSTGVDSIALVPYGSTSRDRPEIRFDRERRSWPTYQALAHLARARRIRVLLKPQLWGPGTYPADIDMPDPESRRRWFAEYHQFVDTYARLAELIHADLFCIGTEFARMSRHESEWRALIAHARTLYRGPIVYAATQGPEFENLRFWDALDYIGLNNYYPLPDNLDTSAILAKVEAVHRRYRKPVIFPEVGFASVQNAHRAPWAEDGPIDLDHQARCFRAIFQTFYRQPWFHGMYWWKIGTNHRGGPRDHSFAFWRKPAWDVLRHWYQQPHSVTH